MDRETTDLSEVRADVVKFEEILYGVIRGTYDPPWFPQDWADRMVAEDELINMRLADDFFDRYRAADTYPNANLAPLSYRLMDVKLQGYFVRKAMPGMHNALFSKTPFDLRKPMETPGPYLEHLCLMQAMIGQARILWDRVMGFVYFLEEGREIPGKSIRRTFFKTLPTWGGKWDALAGCESQIDMYDMLYRTPEFHKNSILRASLVNDEPIDPNVVLRSTINVGGGFWQILLANIDGVRSNIAELCPSIDEPGSDSPTT